MELNRTYIIRITINGRLLTYNATIITEDDTFITFIDKYNNKISVNKKNIESIEEVNN